MPSCPWVAKKIQRHDTLSTTKPPNAGDSAGISRATLHHLPDKLKSLTEMYRVLQPGGVGLVHDMRRDVALDLLEKFTQMRASVGYPPTHVEEKVTLEEARALVIEAGLDHGTVVTSPSSGMGALGFEILIKKPLLA